MGVSVIRKMTVAAAAVLLAGAAWAQTFELEPVILLAQKTEKKGKKAVPAPAPAPKPAPPPAPAPSQAAASTSNVKGKSIAVVAPQASGLAGGLEYLPVLVQGELVSNFTAFSTMKVLDRENLEKLYMELDAAVYADDGAALQDLGNLAHTDYVLGGRITRTVSGYALQLSITRTANNNKTTIASYSGTFTFAELDNLTGVRRASLELLQKIGVTLNEQAQKTLASAAAENHVSAQTALSQGIVAQRQGTEIAALSHYFQAAAIDPTLMEAISRSSVLSSNISSGNIGEDTRNDIAWRKKWIGRLTETEQFFDSLFKVASIPYTLFYCTEVIAGKVDYKTETQTLSVNTVLQRNSSRFASAEKALTAVYDGLAATKRKNEWELKDWPERRTVTELKPFEGWKKEFTVVFELVNDKGKVIGTTELKTGGVWNISPTDSGNVKKPVEFKNVDANEITNKLSIRIESVNGTKAEIAARNGVLQIKALSQKDWNINTMFRMAKGGEITPYKECRGEVRDPTIPSSVWGEPVTSIGKRLFYQCKITNVTIPKGVISIGDDAFAYNELTNVSIPNGVISIGDEAFRDNELTKITIPGSVTSIGKMAFEGNKLTNVSIPNGVISIGDKAFSGNKLINITIPGSVTSIGDRAFESNELTSVTIPGSVTTIGEGAFKASGLTSVTILNGVTSIGKYAFEQNALTSVTIPSSVTTIGDRAFESNELTSVTIPGSVTTIGDRAFESNKLTSVTIPSSVTTIGDKAFESNELTSVTIPGSVTSIGERAFANNNLTSVTILNGVTSIGNNTFSSSSSLTRVTIGANVKINESDKYRSIDRWKDFLQYYTDNGSKAGTYTTKKVEGSTLRGYEWIYGESVEDDITMSKKIEATRKEATKLLGQGKTYSGNGEYDRAILEFNKALEMMLRNSDTTSATAFDVLAARAAAYFGKKNYDKTIEDCDRAIRISSPFAGKHVLHLMRGNAYLNKGDNNKAIPDYDKAIERYASIKSSEEGRRFTSFSSYGIAHQNNSGYSETERKLFEAYANRGIAYQNKGDYGKAVADYEAALGLVPNHPDVYQRWLQVRQQRDR